MSGYDLISAITFNDIGKVKALLSTHPNLTKFQSYDAKTPLHHSCMLDRPHITKSLLSITPETISKPDKHGYSPLDLALLHGNLSTLRMLSELGYADLYISPTYPHCRDLLLAAALGSVGDVRRCVGLFDAWVNWRNANGRCALHWAVIRGDPSIVKTLLDFGADPDRADRWGVSPRMEANHVGGAIAKAFEEVDSL